MIVADHFTKSKKSYPLPNQEVYTVTQKLVDEFICQFGVPERIHTDQGHNFESSLLKELSISWEWKSHGQPNTSVSSRDWMFPFQK